MIKQVGIDKRRVICLIACLLFGLSGWQKQAAAQTRNLPKAGFQTFGQPGNGADSLQPVTGLYLSPGQSHNKQDLDKPYDPRHPQLGFVRWERQKMPIHIWICPGIKLPDLPFDELQQTRVDMVREMLKDPRPFAGLAPAAGWTPEINEVVAAGIEEWRQFETEGLISFDFTDDPRQAHILIFFTDMFKGGQGPGGIAIGGNTCSQPLPIGKVRELESGGKEIVPIAFVQPGRNITQNPVVIELSLGMAVTEGKLRGAAAHEFGHALGIIQHSPFREDLMYVDRVVEELSPADKATLRALYRTAPQGAM